MGAVKGWNASVANPAIHSVSGVIANGMKLTIVLTKADGTLLPKLAMPFFLGGLFVGLLGMRALVRRYELIEHAPKTGKSPTVWAWPQLVDYLKVAGQPVQGPWPPHQQPRPDPDAESMPVAVDDPESARRGEHTPGVD